MKKKLYTLSDVLRREGFPILRLGVMQPYFFPYLGYWQMIHAVDKYVIFDDVNYIKRGWIARNRIKANGQAIRFGIAVRKVSQNRLITEHERMASPEEAGKLLHELDMAYHKAPYYDQVMPLMERILGNTETNLADYLSYEIMQVCDYLGISTPILRSSRMEYDHSGNGQDKILDLCKVTGSDSYVNAIGGRELYDHDRFRREGVELSFLKMRQVQYEQGEGEFIPSLSIIDVMMNNSHEQLDELLSQYDFVS